MSETPPENDATWRLQSALMEFTHCIGGAFPDICTYSLTIGDSYVPFNPDPDEDCDEEESACSQVWVRMETASVTEVTPGWGGDCGTELALELEVGVIRCIEVPEDGEAPTASDVMASALMNVEDMQRILNAALCCDVWGSITVGQWLPLGPQGGQYGGTWSFSVTAP